MERQNEILQDIVHYRTRDPERNCHGANGHFRIISQIMKGVCAAVPIASDAIDYTGICCPYHTHTHTAKIVNYTRREELAVKSEGEERLTSSGRVD